MPGLREALETTYDELDAETVSPVGEVAVDAPVLDDRGDEGGSPPADEGAPQEVDRARDPHTGQFTKGSQNPAPARTPPPSVAGQGSGAAVAPPVASAAPPPAFPRAPQSWKPGIREKWGGLPPEVQAEVVRREREIAQALQQRAEAEKGANGWGEVVRPYEAQIRQAGVEPTAYVGDLLKTAHALTYGPAQQKADLLASLVVQFGVPPEQLDQALLARIRGGQAPQQQAAQQPMRDPRLDEFFAQMQQQNSAQADEAAGSFAEGHEFFGDVANDMADLLDAWAKQGKKSVSDEDLERAYRICCNSNDDVVSIMEQRKAAQSARTAQAASERARQAGSSLRSTPAASGQAQPRGLRATLEERYDELDR